ncbi:MAG: heat shock protein HspQ [Acidobacteria bacterium]|nr:heat shock protein HspQ [Acidobacteriota bacterium]MDA1233745.1 heat shock protein HspQ [Acidobacteriota bacterium]
MTAQAKFSIGQTVSHRLFGYRGVVYDVDAFFLGSEEWYDQVAKSRPPKDQPWYRVLVHDAQHETYVAERNLTADSSGAEVVHPAVSELFSEFRAGFYAPRQRVV